MRSYGFNTLQRDHYELDHLIALEDGGNPTSVDNLWPEPYDIQNNAHIKDTFETYLKKKVCSGSMSLSEAQSELANDWITNVIKDQMVLHLLL